MDQFYKYLKYSAYDNSIALAKLKEEIAIKFEGILTSSKLEGHDIKARNEDFSRHLSLAMKDFVFNKHNKNMADLE